MDSRQTDRETDRYAKRRQTEGRTDVANRIKLIEILFTLGFPSM